jgi:hypothetical protein
MYALVGVVRVKPGHEDEVAAMTREHGPGLVTGMNGSRAAYWARTVDDQDGFQHSFWLFDSEADARAAEVVFSSLRDLPDAPAVFVSVEVCELIAQM